MLCQEIVDMGAPKGNQNAKKGHMARRALVMAVERMHDGREDAPVVEKVKPLLDIWYRAIDEAKLGNIQAANMIMDRLDGKPQQNVDLVADLTHREVKDLTDEELLSIAQGKQE